MILLIDQGNSFLKWNLHSEDKFSNLHMGLLGDLENYLLTLKQSHSTPLTEVLVSSVKSEEQSTAINNLLNGLFSVPIKFAKSSAEFGQMTCAYDDVSTLGTDRWLAMIAAYEELSTPFMVVDAGSAVTLDIVDHTGQHLGGHIIPGLSMQQSQLLAGTDKINISTASGNKNYKATAYELGKSTIDAVKNGCLTNICSYIETMYHRQSNKHKLSVILTGGDAEQLSTILGIKHQIIPDLVLRGLYYSFFSNI